MPSALIWHKMSNHLAVANSSCDSSFHAEQVTHRELQLWVTLTTARMGRTGINFMNLCDRLASSKSISLYELAIACLIKYFEDFILTGSPVASKDTQLIIYYSTISS